MEKVSGVEGKAGVERIKWPVVECVGGAPTVPIKLRQAQRAECTEGSAALTDGAAVELRSEKNRFAPGGWALAIHLVACGKKCGFVGNDQLREVRAGGGIAHWSVDDGGRWLVDALAAKRFRIDVADDWELRGALVEVRRSTRDPRSNFMLTSHR
eukprot:5781862-Prymnesium_polylepis.1